MTSVDSNPAPLAFACPLCEGRLEPPLIGAPDEERHWRVDPDEHGDPEDPELPTCQTCATRLVSNARLYWRPEDEAWVLGIALTSSDGGRVRVELVDTGWRIVVNGAETNLIDQSETRGFPCAFAFKDVPPWTIIEWVMARGLEVWVFHTEDGWVARSDTHQELLDLMMIKRWLLGIELDSDQLHDQVEKAIAAHIEEELTTDPPTAHVEKTTAAHIEGELTTNPPVTGNLNPFVDHPAFRQFTKRDGVILGLMAGGLSFAEIGQTVGLAEKHAHKAVTRILDLLGLSSRSQLGDIRQASDAWQQREERRRPPWERDQ